MTLGVSGSLVESSHEPREGQTVIPLGRLMIPAIRARMGTWQYFLARLRMEDIARRVSLAEEIHKAKSLSELLQRAITKRSEDIAEYLARQASERFFSSLVIGVYGGEPRFYEVEIKQNPYLALDALPSSLDGALGVLVLSGSERFYALDGQHRVAAIRQAFKKDATLGDEEVSALFVAYRKAGEGLRRTRRLFTTLNRYAKPISRRDGIVLDEDDVGAIVTRRLVEGYPLFRDRKISTAHTKALPSTDRVSMTTIVALYDALDAMFRPTQARWTRYKQVRPSDQTIDGYYRLAAQFWNLVRRRFPPLEEVARSTPGEEVASKYRNRDGGHLLFRPIGFRLIVRAALWLEQEGASRSRAVARLARVPMLLSESPWVGLLWNAQRRVMITTKENQSIAALVLLYGAGGNLERHKTNATKLRADLADTMQQPIESTRIKRYA